MFNNMFTASSSLIIGLSFFFFFFLPLLSNVAPFVTAASHEQSTTNLTLEHVQTLTGATYIEVSLLGASSSDDEGGMVSGFFAGGFALESASKMFRLDLSGKVASVSSEISWNTFKEWNDASASADGTIGFFVSSSNSGMMQISKINLATGDKIDGVTTADGQAANLKGLAHVVTLGTSDFIIVSNGEVSSRSNLGKLFQQNLSIDKVYMSPSESESARIRCLAHAPGTNFVYAGTSGLAPPVGGNKLIKFDADKMLFVEHVSWKSGSSASTRENDIRTIVFFPADGNTLYLSGDWTQTGNVGGVIRITDLNASPRVDKKWELPDGGGARFLSGRPFKHLNKIFFTWDDSNQPGVMVFDVNLMKMTDNLTRPTAEFGPYARTMIVTQPNARDIFFASYQQTTTRLIHLRTNINQSVATTTTTTTTPPSSSSSGSSSSTMHMKLTYDSAKNIGNDARLGTAVCRLSTPARSHIAIFAGSDGDDDDAIAFYRVDLRNFTVTSTLRSSVLFNALTCTADDTFAFCFGHSDARPQVAKIRVWPPEQPLEIVKNITRIPSHQIGNLVLPVTSFQHTWVGVAGTPEDGGDSIVAALDSSTLTVAQYKDLKVKNVRCSLYFYDASVIYFGGQSSANPDNGEIVKMDLSLFSVVFVYRSSAVTNSGGAFLPYDIHTLVAVGRDDTTNVFIAAGKMDVILKFTSEPTQRGISEAGSFNISEASATVIPPSSSTSAIFWTAGVALPSSPDNSVVALGDGTTQNPARMMVFDATAMQPVAQQPNGQATVGTDSSTALNAGQFRAAVIGGVANDSIFVTSYRTPPFMNNQPVVVRWNVSEQPRETSTTSSSSATTSSTTTTITTTTTATTAAITSTTSAGTSSSSSGSTTAPATTTTTTSADGTIAPSTTTSSETETTTTTTITVPNNTTTAKSDNNTVDNATQQQNDKKRTVTQTFVPPPPPPKKKDATPVEVASNSLQGSSMVAAAASVAVVPALSFSVARQQAMTDFSRRVGSGICRGISENDRDVAVADSPTQLSIGATFAQYYVGGAVGNVVLSLGLLLLAQLVATFYVRGIGREYWQRPYAVFSNCHISLVLFIMTSILLAPTLTLALVAAAQPFVPVVERAVAVVMALLLLAVAVSYTYWSLYRRRKFEKYKMTFVSPRELRERGCARKLVATFFEGPGEWRLPAPSSTRRHRLQNSSSGRRNRERDASEEREDLLLITEKDRLDFAAATPMIDGFNQRAPWFGAVEFAVQVGLGFASFLAQIVPENKSCVTQAVVLCLVLGAYLVACLYLRPFQELFNRIFIPIMTAAQLLVVIIVAALADESGTPAWIESIVLLTVSMQTAMAILVVVANLGPIVRPILRVWKRLRASPTSEYDDDDDDDSSENGGDVGGRSGRRRSSNTPSSAASTRRGSQQNNNNTSSSSSRPHASGRHSRNFSTRRAVAEMNLRELLVADDSDMDNNDDDAVELIATTSPSQSRRSSAATPATTTTAARVIPRVSRNNNTTSSSAASAKTSSSPAAASSSSQHHNSRQERQQQKQQSTPSSSSPSSSSHNTDKRTISNRASPRSSAPPSAAAAAAASSSSSSSPHRSDRVSSSTTKQDKGKTIATTTTTTRGSSSSSTKNKNDDNSKSSHHHSADRTTSRQLPSSTSSSQQQQQQQQQQQLVRQQNRPTSSSSPSSSSTRRRYDDDDNDHHLHHHSCTPRHHHHHQSYSPREELERPLVQQQQQQHNNTTRSSSRHNNTEHRHRVDDDDDDDGDTRRRASSKRR